MLLQAINVALTAALCVLYTWQAKEKWDPYEESFWRNGKSEAFLAVLWGLNCLLNIGAFIGASIGA